MEKQQVEPSGPDKIYNFVLSELEAGKRPALKLDNSELNQVKADLETRLGNAETSYKKTMAIFCHLQQGNPNLVPLLYKAYLASDTSSRIFVLRAFEKHSLEANTIKGKKVGPETIDVLTHALNSQDLELEAYTLYLLEYVGIQIVAFKKPLELIAGRLSWFNSKKKENKKLASNLLAKIPNF